MRLDSKHANRVARQTRLMFILFSIVCVLITGSALLDQLFDLGWGYDWTTVLAGTCIGLWGGFVYWACRSIFRFMGAH